MDNEFIAYNKAQGLLTTASTPDSKAAIDPYDVELVNKRLADREAYINRLESLIDDLHCALSCSEDLWARLFESSWDLEKAASAYSKAIRELTPKIEQINKQVKTKDYQNV